jgi:hypothetical protein
MVQGRALPPTAEVILIKFGCELRVDGQAFDR